MTTVALARPIPPHRPSSTITPPLSLESSSSSTSPCSVPVPNKHLPICPTGPARPDEPDTPPPSPPSQDQLQQTSALYPLDGFKRLESGELSIYELDASSVAQALDVASRQPLPDPALVFPWFHGLHPQNHVQQSFFATRRRPLRRTPSFAWDIASAQKRWRERNEDQGVWMPEYHTFVCTSPFSEFEENHPEIVAVDASSHLTGNVLDFFNQERREMWAMTEASEFSKNVFMGPTPEQGSPEEQKYDILIECSDLGRLNPLALQLIAESPDDDNKQRFLDFPSSGSILPPTWSHSEADGILETCKWIYHLAHGSYPDPEPALGTDDLDAEGDSPMPSDQQPIFDVKPRKILLHCADGYTESTMLSIAYFSYSTGRPVPEAWLKLHTEKKRNFFAYPTDVALLTSITPRLLRESPVCKGLSLTDITHLTRDEPSWFAALDGSFPSRVLDYMYLGNLGHANNPDLLRALGITQILSVGETAMWREGDLEDWGRENVCVVQGVQDNGIDPLTEEFTRCLEFIDRGRRNGTATLVHCRVGVSRSATICIAEVMRSKQMSFPHAYCYVRARRLNVIIQPHLRFAYELLKYEEALQQDGDPDAEVKRTLEWAEIAREIALMNRPYSR
ncbi:hypothetical protein FOFC_12708 [Fusarium oxysporum]|nr:hypothetical protein FOFC_12708 [Fusarium oxysporum]